MRVSEIYASTQGEGPNVGRTTVFVRFGGCNLRCPGWPCDTQHAIDPAYRDEWKKQTPELVAKSVHGIAQSAGARVITLTGGEPFLQPNDELRQLVRLLRREGLVIDCFSNGTLEYPAWAINAIQFIVDWKLPGSGETRFGPDNEQRRANLAKLGESSLLQSTKFVIKDEEDYRWAKKLWETHIRPSLPIRTYYGLVWDSPAMTNAKLVEKVMKDRLPWYLNVQMHNYIWPVNERGR